MKKIAVTLVFIISTVLFGINAGINASAEETEVLEAQAEEAILQNEIATINTELEEKYNYGRKVIIPDLIYKIIKD